MKLIIASLDSQEAIELDAHGLNYDTEHRQFWMYYALGDDWFQRTTSSLETPPRFAREISGNWFVVFDCSDHSLKLAEWLQRANAIVKHGFDTMRG